MGDAKASKAEFANPSRQKNGIFAERVVVDEYFHTVEPR